MSDAGAVGGTDAHTAFRSPRAPISAAPPSIDPAHDAEREFIATADSAPVFIWKADRSGACTWFNAPWLAFTGRSMLQELGDGWIAGVHPDDVAHCVGSYRNAVAAHEAYQMEYRLRRHDGEYRWLLDHGVPQRDDRGAVVGFIGSCVDVTEQRVSRERTEMLQQLSADLTRGLTRTEVTETVVRHMVAALGAYAGGVVELSDDGTEFVLLATAGQADAGRALHLRYPVDTPLPVRDVVRTRDAVYVESKAAWQAAYGSTPVLPPNGAGDGVWIAVPLNVDDRLLGALTLSLAGSRTIPSDERRFIRTFADLCAQSLERARLFEGEQAARMASEGAADRIAALQAVTSALAGVHAAEAVGNVVLQLGLEAMGAALGGFAILDDDGAQLKVISSAGYPDHLREQYQVIRLDAGVPYSDCVRDGVPVLLQSRIDRRLRYPALEHLRFADDDGALAVVPVISGGRVLGALGATWTNPRVFDEAERSFLDALASQAAQALERARLFEAERSTRRSASAAQARAEFIADATRMLASTLDYDVTLRALSRAVVPRMADWCAIDMLVDPTETGWPPALERVVVTHADPNKVAWAAGVRERFTPDWASSTGLPEALRSGRTQFVREFTDELLQRWAPDEERLALARSLGISSYMCVPLRARGRTFGAITLCMAESKRLYDTADQALAEELAERAATAVEHALVLRDAEQARRDAEQARREAESARAAAEEAREAAEAANQVKAEFLTVMSHELRTPLNAIGGYAELIELGIRGPVTPEQRTDLGRIQRSQRHLLGMINEVLNYARVESGMVRYDIRSVPVSETFDSVEPLVIPQARTKGLMLQFDACQGDLNVRADVDKLQQILVNLLSNAIKFTETGGTVSVSCATLPDDSGTVEITVSDTGIGIAPDQLLRVFEPFVQLGRARYAPGEGAGLGLAISRDLARAMGGELRGESTPGRGSRFTLTLPAS
ncbi:MAG: GAF domain-containing protein [Gemmatimonadota bacterium]